MVYPVNHRRMLLVYGNRERRPWPTLPIGLCYVASALKSRGHLVKVVDLMFVKDTLRVLQAAIQDFQPEMIGVSVRNIDSADWYGHAAYLKVIRDEIIKPMRSVAKVPIIIGGPAVNIAPRQIAEYLDADCAVYGDGERACVDLVEKWGERADSKPAVSHVVWNENRWGAPAKGAEDSGVMEPGRIGDLDSIEFPRINEWIDVRPYVRAGSPYPIQTKRGCAFDCSYCVYGQIEGKAYRQRAPETIAQEIEELSNTGVWRFEFTDSVFNHPAGHAEAVCRAIIDRKLEASFTTTGVNPASFSAELLELMQRAGFEDYSLTPDSASERVLQHLGKGYHSPEVLVRAAGIVRSAKLPMLWWFSFGLPGEDRESVEETLQFVKRHVRKRDLAVCSVGIRIYPGTRLEHIAQEEGQLKPGEDLLAAKFYEPRAISLPEIQKLVQHAARQMPNILLSSEVNSYMTMIRLGNMLKQTFRIRQPLWRAAPLVNWIKHR
jgi:radical SAM superfamily enzyme YgiQ (UPF0313 family)